MIDKNAHVLAHDRANMRTVTYTTKSEWLKARRGIITSTDIGAIAGVSQWASPLFVYAEKLRENEDEEPTEQMLLGQLFQRSIATAYQILRLRREEALWEVVPVPEFMLIGHATNAQHGTSMDCWQTPPQAAKIPLLGANKIPLEIKKTSAYPDEPFEEWLTQVQWQMYVTGSPSCTIAALCGGDDIRWWDIERDDDVIGMLREAADKFLAEHVLPRIPPPSDGHISSKEAIRKLYPMSNDAEIEMNSADMEHVIQIKALKAEIETLEQEQARHADALKMKMANASVAYLPNGGKILWKSTPKAGYYVQPTVVRAFRIMEPSKGKKR